MWAMVILLCSHGTVIKALSHFLFFTDGSVVKTSRKETCAGWGFTAVKSHRDSEEVPKVEACGPVQTAEGEKYCVGATRATNNTAEMQAVIEALFWLNSCVEQKGLPSFSKVMITVDSLYVKGLIDEKFVARENRALAILLCRVWRVTKKKLQLHMRWVRGHTSDLGNSIADELADLGTRLEAQHRWMVEASSRWAIGRKTSSAQRYRVYKEKNTV